MRIVKILLPLVVLALLIYGGIRFFGNKSASAEHMALGTLERDRVTLSATAPEIITSQPVTEGSHVEAGTLLVQLDTALQQATVHKIEADIAQQEANLDKLHHGARNEEVRSATARVETARIVLAESQRDFERIQSIAAQQLASRANLDTATSQRDGNASRLRDAEAQLALVKAGTRSEDLVQAEAQLTATRALLAAEQQRLANLSITATVSGILDTLPWNTGERVSAGAQVAVLLTDNAPYARVYIPETSRAAINSGMQLSVHVDGSSEVFRGTVRWISHEPAFTPYYALNGSERSRLVYLAEVALPATANSLPAGLPAQVELP